VTFVTVGTARQPFNRLIEAVEKALVDGSAGGADVFVQYGSSRRPSVGVAHAFLSRDDHEQILREAPIVVSHAGVGTILTCVRQGKRAVVMPRRAEYGEQVNDHQGELAERLASRGLVFVANDANELRAHLKRPRSDFVIETPPRNTAAIERVRRFLDELEREYGG
jgi:UDP-N-acetylglucosamine transferase subunit ALG13